MKRGQLQVIVWISLAALGCAPAKVPPQPATSAAPPEQSSAAPEFVTLTLDDWTPFPADPDTWAMEGDTLVCRGKPKGYVYSKETYGNFTWTGEYQFELAPDQQDRSEKANTGFMLMIQEPHKVWPRSLEVQGRWDTLGSINSNGGLPAVTAEDHPEVRERVRLPVGEWNRVEITCRDGAITSRLNGELVCTSQPTELKAGLIGLQAEGFVVRFRNLQIRRDP